MEPDQRWSGLRLGLKESACGGAAPGRRWLRQALPPLLSLLYLCVVAAAAASGAAATWAWWAVLGMFPLSAGVALWRASRREDVE